MSRPSEAQDTELQHMILRQTLALAVPLHQADLAGLDDGRLVTIANNASDVIATHGDDLQFGGRHCASTFNALARGLAAAALTAEGGVDFAGQHWCVIPGCRASTRMDHADEDSSDTEPENSQSEPMRPPIQDVPIIGKLL